MERQTIFEILADGLEASVDGRGWNAKHQRAMNIANAGPAMLAALINLIESGLILSSNDHMEEMLEAIASARGDEVSDISEYEERIRNGLAHNDTLSDFDREE